MGKEKRYRKRDFHMMLFDEELKILEEKAESFGMNKTEYIRDLIIRGEVGNRKETLISDEKYKELLYEINRIGNNLNQIAYNSNLKKSTGREEIDGLKKLYEELFLILKKELLKQEDINDSGNNEKS